MTRIGFIGGSEQGDILETKPYGCRLKLFRKKRGEVPPVPPPEGGVLDRGHELEDIVAKRAAAKNGWKIRRCKVMVGDENWQRAQIDRMIVGSPDGPGALECKTASLHIFKKYLRDGLPDNYIAQLQYQMGVTGWKWGAFAVLQPDSWALETFSVLRDDDIITYLFELSQDFWRLVENGPAPEKQDPKSRACGRCEYFSTCHGSELVQIDVGEAGEAEQDESLSDVVARYRDACDIVRDAEDHKDSVRAELDAALNTRRHVMCATGRVLLSSCKREGIDTKRLKTELPEIAAKYMKTSAFSQLRVWPA